MSLWLNYQGCTLHYFDGVPHAIQRTHLSEVQSYCSSSYQSHYELVVSPRLQVDAALWILLHCNLQQDTLFLPESCYVCTHTLGSAR